MTEKEKYPATNIIDFAIEQTKHVGRFLTRLGGFTPLSAPEHMSEHYDALISPSEPVTHLSGEVIDFNAWKANHQPDDIFEPGA